MYLHVQLAIVAFDDGRYSEAADRLDDSVSSITDLFSRRTLWELKLMIFTIVRYYETEYDTYTDLTCTALRLGLRFFVENHPPKTVRCVPSRRSSGRSS